MSEAVQETCRIDNCKKTYRAKGYCGVHYKKWRHGELPKSRYKICTQEGCRKKRHLFSLCEEHYNAAFGKKDEAKAAAPAATEAPAEKAAESKEAPVKEEPKKEEPKKAAPKEEAKEEKKEVKKEAKKEAKAEEKKEK